MEIKKVVFILNSIHQQRCIKRIDEFIERGYNVSVYGFERDGGVPTVPRTFKINIIGKILHSDSMLTRLRIMYRAIREIVRRENGKNIIFYYFLLDVAIVGRLISRRPYIYENSDLMYGYKSKLLQFFFKRVDKYIITKSVASVLTSEGFIEYLFESVKPDNVFVIPNRINKRIQKYEYEEKILDINHIVFSFVGFIRQEAVQSFADVIARHFPQHEFRIYGRSVNMEFYERLAENYKNIKIMGMFSNPEDLPRIYGDTDIIVSALGNKESNNVNIIYAEANKIYEAIYFRKPIIVGTGTFQANKVQKNHWGYNLSDFSEEGIICFINSLSEESIKSVIYSLSKVPREEAIDNNIEIYSYLESL